MRKIKYKLGAGKCYIDDVESFISNVNQFAQINDVYVQVLNAEMICGSLHIDSAIIHALRAYNEKRMRTQSLGMEVLLYASGERQLTRAIPKMGVKKGACSIVVSIISDKHSTHELSHLLTSFQKQFKFKEDATVLSISIEKLKRWRIQDSLIKLLSPDEYEDVILEKVAYVDIIK